MIKITFEVSEDFIREKAQIESAISKMKEAKGVRAVKALFDMVGFKYLESQINKGKTEFVVTPDKLDAKAQELYSIEIGVICFLATISETDKKEETAG